MPLLEDTSKLTAIHLQPGYVQLELSGQLGSFWRFYDLPDFRQTIGEFLLENVQQHRLTWFEEACGQCGESCRRSSILLREQEIFPLQMRLNLSEAEFRLRYLQPATTWNAGDGLIRHQQSGDCPFLERFPGDGSHTTGCSIHDIRPRSCRDYLSSQAICRKDAGHLLERLSSCWLTPELMTFFEKDGKVHRAPMPAEQWLRLGQSAMATPTPDENRLRDLVRSIRDILEEEIASFRPSKLEGDYLSIVGRIHTMLVESSSLVHLGEKVDDELDQAWGRFRHLELLCRGRGHAILEVNKEANPDFPWRLLRITEDGIQMTRPGGESLEVADKLLPQRREVLEQLLGLPDPMVQAALAPADPPCTLCGECCRNYLVEIHPGDITRLSHHLNMSAKSFVENYTTPGRFGWNLKDRILKKKTAPAYSKRLLELVLLGDEETEECVFLERREDGLFYCQVHTHKPDVCRGYQPTNSLCRSSNHPENPGRQAADLAWIEFDETHLWFQTHERDAAELSPMLLQRTEWPMLQQALRGLEQALAAC